MILNALEGKPLPIYGHGQQIRDWIYIEDYCEAIYLVLKQGVAGHCNHIGGENQPTNLTIVKTIYPADDVGRKVQLALRGSPASFGDF